MSTERFRRVAQLWNWLPAFRGVAEHESIQRASVVLGTSPSALSRTVKLLEEASGAEMFERRGQSLSLTPEGARLLAATRDAMRIVDEGLPAVGAVAGRSPVVQIGVASPLASSVAALAAVDATVRDLGVHTVVSTVSGEGTADALLRGELDIVVTEAASKRAGVVVHRIGSAKVGVYASPKHPLAQQSEATTELELSSARFVVLGGHDGWPIERPRNVVASCASLDGVLAFCATTEVVTVLADVLVARGIVPALVRLCDAGPTSPLFTVHRAPVENQSTRVLDTLIAALTTALA
jgi:DNA-binding transcriptional LysR family regulator